MLQAPIEILASLLRLLKSASISKAEIIFKPKNNVIQHPDAKNFPCLTEPLSTFTIFAAWGCVSRRMIV